MSFTFLMEIGKQSSNLHGGTRVTMQPRQFFTNRTKQEVLQYPILTYTIGGKHVGTVHKADTVLTHHVTTLTFHFTVPKKFRNYSICIPNYTILDFLKICLSSRVMAVGQIFHLLFHNVSPHHKDCNSQCWLRPLSGVRNSILAFHTSG